ncbi:hypothetical protein JTE90_006831 [Oedothorax gibbosus]|uniref:Uncharacterized protein n=1 Tax=Oedothorax gibbosus TaxID=931172 RepID=A0AAV6TVH3_9ARAC|nr:hypothetical protein JTE90_006831 [Oedothorax gibbosus]
MCKTKMQTDELLDMILSVSYKQIQARGNNLRLQALLKSTHQFLDRELKEKQQSRKRKWEEIKTDLAKRSKVAADDDVEMVDDELLADQFCLFYL